VRKHSAGKSFFRVLATVLHICWERTSFVLIWIAHVIDRALKPCQATVLNVLLSSPKNKKNWEKKKDKCHSFIDSYFFATYGNVTYFSIHVFLRHTGMLLISRFTFFCDIRECHVRFMLFSARKCIIDSRFLATYGNVTYFSIRVFLRHTGMLLISRFAFFCDIRKCQSPLL